MYYCHLLATPHPPPRPWRHIWMSPSTKLLRQIICICLIPSQGLKTITWHQRSEFDFNSIDTLLPNEIIKISLYEEFLAWGIPHNMIILMSSNTRWFDSIWRYIVYMYQYYILSTLSKMNGPVCVIFLSSLLGGVRQLSRASSERMNVRTTSFMQK